MSGLRGKTSSIPLAPDLCHRLLTFVGAALFLASVPVKALADNFYYQQGYYPSYAFLRHLLLAGTLGAFLGALFLSEQSLKGLRLIRSLAVLCVFLLGASLVKAFGQGVWPLASFKALTFLFLPLLLAFSMVNSQREPVIRRGMKLLFWLVVLLYLQEKSAVLRYPQELLTIDFFTSYSPLESSALAPHVYGFLIYFLFCCRSRGYAVGAVLLNLLVFKRINLLAALPLLLFFLLKIKDRPLSGKWKYGLILFFVSLVGLECQILQRPDLLETLAEQLGFDGVQGLVMGRNKFVLALLSADFHSSGFGSTGPALENLLGKKGLELDLMQLMLELGWSGVVVTVGAFWLGIKERLYPYLILLLLFCNMLTSYQLTESYGMLYHFLCFFLLSGEVEVDRQ